MRNRKLIFAIVFINMTLVLLAASLMSLPAPAAASELAQIAPTPEGGTNANLPPNTLIFEGDIIMPIKYLVSTSRGAYLNFSTYPLQYWPNGVVPYVFSANVLPSEQAAMRAAMDEWEANAGVRFIPRTSESYYLFIQDSTGNSSYIGRRSLANQPQTVNIYNWNYKYIMAHELSHALGFFHEQSRPDRDTYVTINSANIISGYENNFTKYDTTVAGTYGAYDFTSVMHYPYNAFSSNGQPTIVTKPGYEAYQYTMGQRSYLSTLDKAAMNFLYPKPTGTFTAPANGATISSNPLTISATASDDSGIASVTFKAKWGGGAWQTLNVDTTAPYSYNWDLCANGIPTGALDLTFDVLDGSGKLVTSIDGVRTVTNANTCSPATGSFTSPAAGATITNGIVNLAATADDSDGITSVTFKAKWGGGNWQTLNTDTSAPYAYDWNICAINVPNGSIDLTFDVLDNGTSLTSMVPGTLTITNNSGCISTGAFTSPAAGASISTNLVNIAATASDFNGVTSVTFKAKWGGGNWQTLNTDTSAPYGYDWNLCVNNIPTGAIDLTFDVLDNVGQTVSAVPGTRTVTNATSCASSGAFTSPTAGATITTGVVNLAATVNDYDGITSVTFKAKWGGGNWQTLNTDTSAPYAYNWDLCAINVPNGNVDLTFDVLDGDNQNTAAVPGTLTIVNNSGCASTGAFTSPTGGATITSGQAALGATANDYSGVASVTFKARWGGGAWQTLNVDTSAPYSYDWNLCTSNVLDGAVDLTFDVQDTVGQTTPAVPGTLTFTNASLCQVFNGTAPARNLFNTATPTLTFNAVSWATAYQLQISKSAAFAGTVVDVELPINPLNHTIANPLANGVYYWRLRARDANGVWGAWGPSDTFVVFVPVP